jgi:hypothetical protein
MHVFYCDFSLDITLYNKGLRALYLAGLLKANSATPLEDIVISRVSSKGTEVAMIKYLLGIIQKKRKVKEKESKVRGIAII